MEEESSIDYSLLSEGSSDGDPAPATAAGRAKGNHGGYPVEHGQQQQLREELEDRALDGSAAAPAAKRRGSKVLSSRKLKRIKEQHSRRGILYMSRIPPHMKPAKIKELLSQYGAIGRVYCKPEDASIRKQRMQKGGNTGKNFTEGWIEFEDKATAKEVAAMLNGQAIGGKKRSAYHFDLWNLKYLPKFKWDHLTEEIAYEKAVREQKLANELSAARKERDFYLSRVDRAKAVKAIAERKAGKAATAEGDVMQGGAAHPEAAASAAAEGGGGGRGEGLSGSKGAELVRHYGQRRAKPDPVTSGQAEVLPDELLSMVVARKRKRQK